MPSPSAKVLFRFELDQSLRRRAGLAARAKSPSEPSRTVHTIQSSMTSAPSTASPSAPVTPDRNAVTRKLSHTLRSASEEEETAAFSTTSFLASSESDRDGDADGADRSGDRSRHRHRSDRIHWHRRRHRRDSSDGDSDGDSDSSDSHLTTGSSSSSTDDSDGDTVPGTLTGTVSGTVSGINGINDSDDGELTGTVRIARRTHSQDSAVLLRAALESIDAHVQLEEQQRKAAQKARQRPKRLTRLLFGSKRAEEDLEEASEQRPPFLRHRSAQSAMSRPRGSGSRDDRNHQRSRSSFALALEEIAANVKADLTHKSEGEDTDTVRIRSSRQRLSGPSGTPPVQPGQGVVQPGQGQGPPGPVQQRLLRRRGTHARTLSAIFPELETEFREQQRQLQLQLHTPCVARTPMRQARVTQSDDDAYVSLSSQDEDDEDRQYRHRDRLNRDGLDRDRLNRHMDMDTLDMDRYRRDMDLDMDRLDSSSDDGLGVPSPSDSAEHGHRGRTLTARDYRAMRLQMDVRQQRHEETTPKTPTTATAFADGMKQEFVQGDMVAFFDRSSMSHRKGVVARALSRERYIVQINDEGGTDVFRGDELFLLAETAVHYIRGAAFGRGAHGRVYGGLSVHDGRLIAIKQMKLKSVLQAGEDQSASDRRDARRRRRQRERCKAQAPLQKLTVPSVASSLGTHIPELELMRCMRHPNIVQFLGYEISERNVSILMERVSGGSVASLLKEYGAFPEELAQSYIRQALRGLVYLHRNHIMHRDLKGANILVTTDGVVKLADFGVAKQIHETVTGRRNTVVGTPFWMAPEVVSEDAYGRKADVWSLGCCLIEMLTATHPWKDHSSMSVLYALGNSDKLPPLPLREDQRLSATALDFLRKCLVRDPQNRPTSRELLTHPWVAAYDRVGAPDKLRAPPPLTPTSPQLPARPPQLPPKRARRVTMPGTSLPLRALHT